MILVPHWYDGDGVGTTREMWKNVSLSAAVWSTTSGKRIRRERERIGMLCCASEFESKYIFYCCSDFHLPLCVGEIHKIISPLISLFCVALARKRNEKKSKHNFKFLISHSINFSYMYTFYHYFCPNGVSANVQKRSWNILLCLNVRGALRWRRDNPLLLIDTTFDHYPHQTIIISLVDLIFWSFHEKKTDIDISIHIRRKRNIFRGIEQAYLCRKSKEEKNWTTDEKR